MCPSQIESTSGSCATPGSPTQTFPPENGGPDERELSHLDDYRAFGVEGEVDGHFYRVSVFYGGELGSRVELRGDHAEPIVELLPANERTPFEAAAPVGFRPLDLADPLTILVALEHFARVHEVSGDVLKPRRGEASFDYPVEH